MLYIQYIYVSAPLFLSVYIEWRAVKGGEEVLHPLPLLGTASDLFEILLENFSNYRSVGQSRFTQ